MNEDVYIEARPIEVTDLAKKLNKREREFLEELLKENYREGFENGLTLNK